MNSEHHLPQSFADTESGIRKHSMPTPAMLTVKDMNQLLQICESGGHAFLTRVLRQKIDTAQIVEGRIAGDVVTGGSRVIYALDDAAPQTGLLVHRARAGVLGGVIPVATLLGVTLIGMRVGQRAQILSGDGAVTSLFVSGVAQDC